MDNVLLQEDIQSIVAQIVKKYHPEKIILFGSAASGEYNSEKSDLDFLIIKNDKRNIHERMVSLYHLVKKKHPADFLVYTPKEVEKKLALGDPFLKSVLEEGKLLYG